MAIKTLLVCLTNETNAESLMNAACIIARQHRAHLIALHTIEAMTVYPGIAIHIPDIAVESFYTSQVKQSDAIKAILDRHTVAEDFVSEWRLLKNKSTSTADRIIDSARIADLVMMPNEDPDNETADQHHMQETVIRNAGRPVLIVPQDFTAQTIGQSILVGWNDTCEAARAAHDVLTLTARSDITSRSHCKFPLALSARHRERAGGKSGLRSLCFHEKLKVNRSRQPGTNVAYYPRASSAKNAHEKTRPGGPERAFELHNVETITPFFAGLATTYSPVP